MILCFECRRFGWHGYKTFVNRLVTHMKLNFFAAVAMPDFWGPLFVGCVASHFFPDLVKIFDDRFGFGGGLATYPCVVILCTMGSAHVGTHLLVGGPRFW